MEDVTPNPNTPPVATPAPLATPTATPAPIATPTPVTPTAETKNAWEGLNISDDYKHIVEKYKGGPADAVKALAEAQKLLGKKALTPPADDASPEEFEAWYKHIGRPESTGEYDFEVAEDIAPYLNKDFFEEFKDIAYKELGLTKKQFQKVCEFRFKEWRAQEDSIRQFAIVKSQETEMALKREWGEDYEAFKNEAYTIAKDNGIYDLASQTGMLNTVEFMKFMRTCAAGMAEGGVIGAQKATSVQDTIKSLMQTKAYSDPSHKDHSATMKKIFELNGQLSKRDSTVNS